MTFPAARVMFRGLEHQTSSSVGLREEGTRFEMQDVPQWRKHGFEAPCAGRCLRRLWIAAKSRNDSMSTWYRKMRLTSISHIAGPQGWARLGVSLSTCNTASGVSLWKEKALDTLRAIELRWAHQFSCRSPCPSVTIPVSLPPT
jgi:hypothetical protein